MMLTNVYNRQRAVNYANRYWNSHNPYYLLFPDDCTNYVSQCLHAGGLPMVSGKNRNQGWWYRRVSGGHSWSYSWAVAHSLYTLLRNGGPTGRCRVVSSPRDLELGDVLCYDWEGDGRWNHNTIITAFDAEGQPLVNAHTFNSQFRRWEYRNSPAWTPRTRYSFFHIE